KYLFIFSILFLFSGCDIVDTIIGSGKQNNSTNIGGSSTDLTELIDSTNWIDIDIQYTYYDIVDDPETYDGDDGEVDVGCYKLIHDGSKFSCNYDSSTFDFAGKETMHQIFIEGEFNDTKDTLVYLKVHEHHKYQDSSGWWDDEGEIVINDFIPLSNEDIITLIDDHRVIEYYYEFGVDAHFVAWRKVKLKDVSGNDLGGYEIHDSKGGGRFLKPRIRFYLD
ncbi:MAG: hypothetical protein GWP19_06935, partial [Planctomycetia bacterium]|nr:hypothetical protein [Planctomycetia bacterium]